jgi:predicted Zn-ribbon and HTH transcriptional regulator
MQFQSWEQENRQFKDQIHKLNFEARAALSGATEFDDVARCPTCGGYDSKAQIKLANGCYPCVLKMKLRQVEENKFLITKTKNAA